MGEAAPFVFQEELPRKGKDTLRTEDHHLTAIPTRSLKSWSKHVAWTNKQTVDLKQVFFVITFSNHPNSDLVSDQSIPYSQLQCATVLKTQLQNKSFIIIKSRFV